MDETEKIAILQKLIQIKSVNGNEAAVARYIASLFEPYQQSAKVEFVTYSPGRDNLVITIGNPNGKQLGLSGHEDVVDPGELSTWHHDPFAGEIAAGNVYGRGASDMKSGLAAIVIAMLELLADGTPLNGSIRLLATVGEETGEYGAAQLTKAGYADQLAALVIAEPTGLDKIAYTARGVIDYHVDSIGKSVHSAQSAKGINAIDNLIVFYNEVTEIMQRLDKIDPVLGGLLHNVDLISGGEQINTIPGEARLSANVRTIPAYPNQMIYDILEKLVHRLNDRAGFQLKLSYSYPEEAVPGRSNAPLVKLAQKIGHRVIGNRVIPVGAGGASDASEFLQSKAQFSAIVYGPGTNTSHEPDEYIEIEQFLQATMLYRNLALAFLAGEGN
ncbi:acetylornithine deacetylase/succinyl-diaminopimelate desuccinylase [Secundilactobacillus pentosiphilus]|uniref:Probable succinyl-diaminopimelate desuccinylase n=1 Tax=Secundilactobacillus pentosiphilus TaxID=1714682 RepID=A0A1Z5IRB0_9LACO|nr:ArgE/DapE family deacylase [Secundilactobacillus pentosiphilus]GAX04303.1 acetylornithine deacetylase/succinyl-diaminopimelate desuccinylase [Secundilactobacillus pentosiphilus]